MVRGSKVQPVVLCGGAGTRLWPLSRTQRPKQLLSLIGSRSLLEQTLRRCASFDPPVLIGSDAQRFALADTVLTTGYAPVVLCEPARRDTAAAACLAALWCHRQDPDGVLLLLPADHRVADPAAFEAAVAAGLEAAAEDRIVVFGVQPDRPATGYGYIAPGAVRGSWRCVEAFVEKPDEATATGYLAQGYVWNAGIFLGRAAVWLAEFERLAPAVLRAVTTALDEALTEGPFVRLEGVAWATSPSVPVDIAILEKTACAAVVEVEMGWADLGSFEALWEHSAGEGSDGAPGNALLGDAIQQDCEGCYLHGEDILVAADGVRDLVVVGTRDAVLVRRRDMGSSRPLVQSLKGRVELDEPPLSERPWGTYRIVDRGPGFQVKRLTVRPGERLSLQRHRLRDEHWVVARGIAAVEIDGERSEVGPRGHVDIAVGVVHRLQNIGEHDLVLVEVQFGDYLGEDDIERLEDVYGRT